MRQDVRPSAGEQGKPSTAIGSPLNLDAPVSVLPLVGPAYIEKLTRLGITTLDDLLHHYPFRYADLSSTVTIATAQAGDTVTLAGTVIGMRTVYVRGGKTLQQAQFSDGTGLIKVTWFNQPYLARTFQQHPQVSLSGTIKLYNGKPTLTAPEFEFIKPGIISNQSSSHPVDQSTSGIHTGRLVPVYPETAGVSSKWLRSRMNTLLKILPYETDWLPDELRQSSNLIDYDTAVRNIHFPETNDLAVKSRQRLAFDELLLWQLTAQIRKRRRQQKPNAFPVKTTKDSVVPFIKTLPFRLTDGQHQAIDEIVRDLGAPTPMNRLLQGDVGSGKTIVAAAAMYLTVKNGYKAVLMAPTEILAHQHADTVNRVLSPHGITIGVATRSSKKDLRQADVVIGTQAVLYRELPQNVGLVVIDEQHRFGVRDRSKLLQEEKPPHLLSMTATPIPRTVALTLYAELDVSVLSEMPLGRIPVKTWVVGSHKRQGAYEWIRKQIKEGGQAFIVCPLIEDSESEALNEVKAAETEFNKLHRDIFPDLNVGMVHGRMKPKEKDRIINDFSTKKIDILVATPVIEVGIDIKDATIMVIEGAERFGLASLHQLRGRVGRGDRQSYCLLFPTSDHTSALTRLKYLETTHSGFQLAELDLKLRGPGDVYGTMQSGFLDLKIASLTDEPLIRETHREATRLLQDDPYLTKYPQIKNRLNHLLASLSEPN